MLGDLIPVMAGVAIALISGAAGYYIHDSATVPTISIQNVTAPPANSVRVLYSLTARHNDREVIALIDSAQRYVYFAMYEFTLRDIADALVAAKKRGVDVEGIAGGGADGGVALRSKTNAPRPNVNATILSVVGLIFKS